MPLAEMGWYFLYGQSGKANERFSLAVCFAVKAENGGNLWQENGKNR
jgi:hypothetical protein